ncbi:Crp/Fnr family transcriptional regulator [Aestuariispira ectoiniformans]|uniref:Crp/Fnr family transcriptional regulator n=1 Tax=Aestuariispira ectoiniformans TaxID=2775080 RepID=UPI00223BBE44|nr:Crp/Fnr family transcriptional regulator [Aestuariispira ectoiniformans]
MDDMSNLDLPLARKLSTFIELKEEDLLMLTRLHENNRIVEAGSGLEHQGAIHHKAYILRKGWVFSYKLLKDGARQIVDFQISGDFLGLRSLLLRTSDHSFEPITQIEVSEVTKEHLKLCFEMSPRLAAALLWAASRDEAMVVEHLIDIGRRSAIVRTAHFLLELGVRLELVGLADRNGYHCPLTQYLLADALGLSAIHLNRCLRKLREKNLLSFQGGQVTYLDFTALTRLADFDSDYMDHEKPILH